MLRTLALPILLLPLSVAAAQAGDFTSGVSTASQTVAYGDLNPLAPADAKILAVRLETAAQAVCEKAIDGMPLASRDAAVQQCMDTAINVALTRISSRMSEKVHNSLALARP